MALPHVERGRIVAAFEQNAIIDEVNRLTQVVIDLGDNTGGGGNPGDIDDAIEAHVVDPTPHPIYDDIPSLNVLFENGLV